MLPVDHEGKVNLDDVRAALRPEQNWSALVSPTTRSARSNPLAALSKITKEHGALVAC
jgi:cysteine sulfinate desulfinase/cysteine desulfurase-like protein